MFCKFCGSVSPLDLVKLWFCSWVLSHECKETTSSWYCWYLSKRPDRRVPNSVDWKKHLSFIVIHQGETRAIFTVHPCFLTLVCRVVYLWWASCSLLVTSCLVLCRAGSEPPSSSRAPWTELRTFWPEMETKRRSALWQITSSASWKETYIWLSKWWT